VIRPPIVIVLIALLLIALGETSGAVLSEFRAPFARYARARIAAKPATHGLIGAAEYDDEVRARTLFAAEAGVSFFHTHAEGLGLIVLFVSTVTATVVPWARLAFALHALIGIGGLFPLGYLVYTFAVLERGRDAGVDLAEWYVLTPLGASAILGLLVLAGILITRVRAR
jgi:hypothetical protein